MVEVVEGASGANDELEWEVEGGKRVVRDSERRVRLE